MITENTCVPKGLKTDTHKSLLHSIQKSLPVIVKSSGPNNLIPIGLILLEVKIFSFLGKISCHMKYS